MYILQYDFVALLLNIINLTVFMKLKNIRDAKSRVLLAMLLNSTLTTIFDILSSLAIGHPKLYSQGYGSMGTNIYYFLNNNMVYIYLIYVFMLTGIESRLTMRKKHLIFLPYLVTTFMILVNPFMHIIFRIDENLVYYREIGLFILYGTAFLHLVFWSIYCFRYMEKMDPLVFRALVSFVIIYILSALLQTLYPRYLIQGFASAISELIMIMVLQDRKEWVDGITQLYNQNAFYDKLQSVTSSNASASVTLVMIEDTSRITYTLGYKYLTKIIQEVAHFIKVDLYVKDSFYIRKGCFALLYMKPSERKCAQIREKLTGKFNESWHINGLAIKLSARITQYAIPDQISDYSHVYEYINYLTTLRTVEDMDKQNGMMKINFDTYFRQQQVKKAIALALEKRSFEVYYQPIYSVEEKRFVSAEALIRLKDPELGFIPPDAFIPITEQDGTIAVLGMQIFETVCSLFNKAELDKMGIQYIEVNLSAVQCMQKNIKQQILALMEANQISPSQICLEITETVAINTSEILRDLFKELDELGMTFALDDYGSGYANINYILGLPFHFVKLDKTIVWNYFEDDIGKVTLESNISMMKSLGVKLIAEGVETKEQADALINLGVDYLQGYYFSKPIPEEDFIQFILEKNKA